jgi:hypothetical protein
MRVLITGSRTWTDQKAVWASLDYVLGQFLEAHPMDAEELVVVHGACPKGADLHAAQWVARRIQAGARVAEERHAVNWSRGRNAGFLRNQEMVDLGADVCLTLIDRCRSPKCRPEPHGSWCESQRSTRSSRSSPPSSSLGCLPTTVSTCGNPSAPTSRWSASSPRGRRRWKRWTGRGRRRGGDLEIPGRYVGDSRLIGGLRPGLPPKALWRR